MNYRVPVAKFLPSEDRAAPRSSVRRFSTDTNEQNMPHEREIGSAPLSAKSRARWTRIGWWLVVATMVYNVVEAVVALWSGSEAGSIALVGFGLDSVIECIAAAALLWRLHVEARANGEEDGRVDGNERRAQAAEAARRAPIERAERRVHQIVGVTFILLALYVTAQAGWTLWRQSAPEESPIGIALAIASLTIMPLVSWGKLRAARKIGSAALRAEAKETLACSYLSFTLLLGLLANAVAGWWWADPVAAILMVPWLVKEGQEGLSSEEGAND
jgi:divalent metal cation (Fe/Co/Zn/Cd) transporter